MFEPYFEIRFVFRFNKPMMFGVVGGRAYNHFTWISGYIVSQKKGLLGSSTTNSCLEMVWYWPHKSDINELVYLAPSSIQTLITNHVGHPHVLSSLHSSSRKFACTVACSASVKGCRASSSVSSFWSFFWNLGSPFSLLRIGVFKGHCIFLPPTHSLSRKTKRMAFGGLGCFLPRWLGFRRKPPATWVGLRQAF